MVSIIVPVYNTEEYLAACLESILGQTYQDIECILIDDGSTDTSPSICSKFAQTDRRVVFHRQKNAGVSGARNQGLSIAKGDLILFADSDDILRNTMVEEMVHAMETDRTDCVVCGISIFTDTVTDVLSEEAPPRALLHDRESAASYFAKEYSATIMNSPCNKLYKKAFINNRFDLSIDIGEDLLFNLQYFQMISSISYLDRALYCYRRNVSDSLSVKLRANMSETANHLYRKCIDYLYPFKGPFDTKKISYFHYKNLQLATLGIVQTDDVKKNKITKLRNICSDHYTKQALLDIAEMPLGKKDRIFWKLMYKEKVRLLYWVNVLWLHKRQGE